MKKPELLSPAGNMEALKAAVEAGADAIYVGGLHFGARAYATNFNDEEMIEAINYCHLYSVKIYVTVNTMITEELVKPFINYIDFLHKNNVDAIIISDLGMIDYVRKVYPNLEIHASTQTHIHNLEGTKFIEELGVKRVVLARETDLELIKEIKKNTNIELEIFVHGALCISYSGECLMSSLIGGRSGNKGTCAQVCRMKYNFSHEGKIINTDKYLLSTKDLNTLYNIDKLIDIGVDSLKIEGRMKSKEYVYLVTKLYRKAIDSYIETKKIDIKEEDIINLKKIFNRKYTKGFLMNEDNNNFINPYRPNHIGVPIGSVIESKNGFVKIKLIDNLNLKDGIRILDNEDYGTTIYKMKKEGKYVEEAYKGDIVEIKIDKKINVNSEVIKTTDYKLNELIKMELEQKRRKINITGEIICKLNNPIILSITDGINNVKVSSDYIIEKSKNVSLSIEDIKKQLNKLGNTTYKFDNLNIILDDNIFINIKELNEIRRKAVEELNNKRLYKIPYKKQEYKIDVLEFNEESGYTYLIKTQEDYNKIKEEAKEIIVDDINLYNEIMLDNKVVLRLPRVMYNYPEYNIKLLVGECGSIYKYKNIISDFSFNVANSYTVAFLHSLGIKRITLSIELNDFQIKKLIENYYNRYQKKPNLEVIISSVPETMISKFNLVKYFNVPNNDNYLIDKFNNKFKVKIKDNLMYIYHYKRLELENKQELFDMGINTLRIEK